MLNSFTTMTTVIVIIVLKK